MILDRFPQIKHGYLITPRPDVFAEDHDNIYERLCCAIYMAANINNKKSMHMISKNATSKAYIRACLAEFVSIEDMLRLKYPNNTEAFSIVKSKNPLLHIMKLLRDYNIHLGTTSVSKHEISVALKTSPEVAHNISTITISNLEINSLKNLNNAKHYSDDTLKKMIDGFNAQQMEFGVADLIISGILEYSSRVKEFLTSNP